MSVFTKEWRACMREQYKHVIRTDDQKTLVSLTKVMHRVGFGEDELAQLRIEATMHVDDMPDDFVPDMEVLQPVAAEAAFEPHPLECQCPECMQIETVPHDDEGQPLDEDAQQELLERQQAEQDDGPQQMSMF